MRLVALTLVVAGCAGGADGATGTDTDTDDTDVGGTTDPCGAVPNYDPSSLDCASLAVAYENVVDAADGCTTASECRAFYPDCAQWNQVNCWYVANECAADALGALADRATNELVCASTQQCSGCGGAPEMECTAGKCVAIYASY